MVPRNSSAYQEPRFEISLSPSQLYFLRKLLKITEQRNLRTSFTATCQEKTNKVTNQNPQQYPFLSVLASFWKEFSFFWWDRDGQTSLHEQLQEGMLVKWKCYFSDVTSSVIFIFWFYKFQKILFMTNECCEPNMILVFIKYFRFRSLL